MRLRILLVEDDPLNRELVLAILGAADHEVIEAHSAQMFREMLVGPPPDIVLMDMMLPDGNGIALLAELKLKTDFVQTPVLAVTAQVLAGDVARFLAAGFAAVITKPINTRTFTTEVTQWAHLSQE
jgi:CheY-like chemotaxis protein